MLDYRTTSNDRSRAYSLCRSAVGRVFLPFRRVRGAGLLGMLAADTGLREPCVEAVYYTVHGGTDAYRLG